MGEGMRLAVPCTKHEAISARMHARTVVRASYKTSPIRACYVSSCQRRHDGAPARAAAPDARKASADAMPSQAWGHQLLAAAGFLRDVFPYIDTAQVIHYLDLLARSDCGSQARADPVRR